MRPLRRSERRQLRKLAAREWKLASGGKVTPEWRVTGNILQGGRYLLPRDGLTLAILENTRRHGHVLQLARPTQ